MPGCFTASERSGFIENALNNEHDAALRSEMAGWSRKLPMLVLKSGLLPVLELNYDDSQSALKKVLEGLKAWLKLSGFPSDSAEIKAKSVGEIILITEEALRCLATIKRYLAVEDNPVFNSADIKFKRDGFLKPDYAANFIREKKETLGTLANPGLVLFDFVEIENGKVKKEHLKNAVIKKIRRNEDVKEKYADFFMRWEFCIDALGAEKICFTTSAPLAVGLSNASLLNNAITVSSVYGAPYLPGTGIKGVVKSWAVENGVSDIDIYFEEGNGLLDFHNAYPKNFALEIDVITPEFKGYYDSSGETPPAFWLEANPIFFPVIPADTDILFSVGGSEKEKGAKWLCQTLSANGMGAKTNNDFGRFKGEAKGEGE